MDTQTIEKVRLTGNRLEEAVLAAAEPVATDILLSEMENHLWIKFNKGYYVPEYEMLIGDPEKDTFPTDRWLASYWNLPTKRLNSEQAKYLYYDNKSDCPFIANDFTKGNNSRHYICCDVGCIETTSGRVYGWADANNDHLKIPSAFMSKIEFAQTIARNGWQLEEPNILAMFKPADSDKIISGRNKALGIPRAEIEKYLAKTPYSGENLDSLIEDVLTADEHRAGIERYDRKCVEDVNLGHWELWSVGRSDGVEVPLAEKLVARNPLADIRPDGLVGIDFGTKSTIVSFQDGSDAIKLHRVGMGQLSKKVKASDYENPTVIEFINMESFMKDYASDEGRPLTSLEDLTVSHKAYSSLKNSETSDDFYSFFYDIKQWCGDSSRYKQLKIVDKNGHEHILPPYLEIKDGDLDPVEIYAYYLGLYINNMRNGIFLNYALSFPVSYEKAVKAKLLNSFERGLKKSLPDAVLSDKDSMDKFRVTQGITEPAAYAICALKSYGFDPEDEDDKTFYGIFDFGGGTTDFDFGVWRGAADTREERRYDYVINHFGAEGDQYLGGENLLELMAYEVFKANKDSLLPDPKQEDSVGFSFFKPTECEDFPGSEVLISTSQEAKRNTKQLMEALRPVWEQKATTEKEYTCPYHAGYNVRAGEQPLASKLEENSLEEQSDIGYTSKQDIEIGGKMVQEHIPSPGDLYHYAIETVQNRKDPSIVKLTKNDIQTLISLYLEISGQAEAETFEIIDSIFAVEMQRCGYSEKSIGYDWGASWNAARMWRLKHDADAVKTQTDECGIIRDGYISVDLYDKNGRRQPGQKLYIEKPDENIHVDLYKILEDRIDRGVVNFFEALKLTFKGESSLGAEKIHIFLAGNSSRSPLVKKCFDRHIEKIVSEINKQGKAEDFFELYPPLGTEEAYGVQMYRGIKPDPEDLFAPTGKTGVALGLIEGRAGGPVKVISEISSSDEIKFKYYVGRQRKKKFKVVVDRESMYNTWTDFGIPSDEADFELYYSTLPEVSTNDADISGIAKKHCRLTNTDSDGTVYIRPVSPDEIEICAAMSDADATNGKYISEPEKISLSK